MLAWVFPESWHFALEGMVEVFLHSASQDLLINLALAASLILVTITLFPLKEHLSHAFEEDGELTEEEVDPVPLHLEAWEELKLVLLYATFFMSVFWVGYSPESWRQSAAWVLSTTFLALTFAIDFVSPTLFRHGMRYATVFKTLARYPFVSLSFGLLFAAPPILAGMFMNRVSPENWVWILIGLFVAEVVAIVWACVGGTWLAAKMWPEVKGMRPPFWGLRVLYWAIVGSLLVWNVKAFSAVGKSLYHKVPLFKSHYSIVPGSMEFDGGANGRAFDRTFRGFCRGLAGGESDADGFCLGGQSLGSSPRGRTRGHHFLGSFCGSCRVNPSAAAGS